VDNSTRLTWQMTFSAFQSKHNGYRVQRPAVGERPTGAERILAPKTRGYTDASFSFRSCSSALSGLYQKQNGGVEDC